MRSDWQILIRDAKIFDGNGGLPWRGDIAVSDGRVVELRATENGAGGLDPNRTERVVDARGLWALPGLLDIHTHYDLEVELAPTLPESVRHGTTTVIMSNCSLGLAFGAQRNSGDGADPIVDCFARVENMPKHVLKKAADLATWNDSREYLEHLDKLPLGPNVVPMIPHSMLRIEAMGFQASVSRHPDREEVEKMRELLRKGLREGYAGFSTDALPFHYLANDPNRHLKIPTQYARYDEIKALTHVAREFDRVWQATPPKDSKIDTIRTLLLTSGRFFGRPLRTTVVAAMDIVTNRSLGFLAVLLARVLNSRFIRGRFYMQALAAPFKIWSDGPITPIAEEIPELRALNEPDLEDRAGRRSVWNDPAFVQRFRAMWNKGKRGFSPARLRRLLRLEDFAFSRSLDDMTIERCPIAEWQGLSFAEVFDRLHAYRGAEQTDRVPEASRAESEFFGRFPATKIDEADFVIELLRSFDTELVWHTVTANTDPAKTRRLLMDPQLLPGFNDSGAHLTNMAFYDCNLRALKMAWDPPEPGTTEAATPTANDAPEMNRRDRDVAYMVRRLTRDAAEVFNIDAGVIETGARADIALIDPRRLAVYDGEATVERVYRPEFEHEQLVNRSEGVVHTVLIAGKIAWQDNEFAAEFGRASFGRRLAPPDSQIRGDEYSNQISNEDQGTNHDHGTRMVRESGVSGVQIT